MPTGKTYRLDQHIFRGADFGACWMLFIALFWHKIGIRWKLYICRIQWAKIYKFLTNFYYHKSWKLKKLQNLLCTKKLTYRLDQICYHSGSQAEIFPLTWSKLWNILDFLHDFWDNYLISAIIKAYPCFVWS